jgi:hypothetical protein
MHAFPKRNQGDNEVTLALAFVPDSADGSRASALRRDNTHNPSGVQTAAGGGGHVGGGGGGDGASQNGAQGSSVAVTGGKHVLGDLR